MDPIRQLPITLNESGDLVIKRSNDAMIEKLFALVQTQFASQSNMLEEVGQDVGKLGEAVDMHTEKVETLDQTVGSFDERLTKAQLSNVASKIIRDDLQKDRHRKAQQFVGNKVQLTFEAMEGSKNDLEQAVRDLIKKDTTKVMRQITSYLKQQLGLKSIDDIPNCLVKKHKQLLKELTWKKLNNFTQKGGK
ncbi:hypothetical protein ACS47_13260 [Bacillus cereus]|uniref:Uncharacterized protein n=6 Tax=root TaxID=1 RepID=B5LPL3_9CAUD|nr:MULTISPECIES: hypothetical protein [Bacteria]YP_002154327.1 hypothetical protein IEBH_gp02 [Bacillus phage IEBH]YP_009219613.1 hypothetical protein AVT71_gp39 [Bacillus phage 250]EJR03470.1 hypothetical protein II7_05676 [Bacillus cereus MSX-A12]KLA04038.1 hypothetical protein B4153_5903 [Bacillus cereus]MRA63511.1 hypothetical protein [Bacillus thuringiensis]OUB93063.1 hypothetical protein BK752_27250 [Bacillus thuringiensis serovar canadensis]HDR7248269.1 hypothetical protein [Bacillus 